MTIKTVLAPLFDSALDAVVVDASTKLAIQFDAHLEALLLKAPLDLASRFTSSGFDTEQFRRMLETLGHQVEIEARTIREKFELTLSRAGIDLSNDPSSNSKPTANWRVETGDPTEILSRCGGAFDLIVAGHPSLGSEQSKSEQVLDAAMFNTARPVLLTPQTIAPTIGKTILLAWNRGIPAGRALVAAQPFLERAERVVILTITTGAKQGPEPEDIAKNLGWHGISAEVKKAPPSSKAVADIIIDEAGNIGADLIVMGAYSQSRIRERVLGGVTTAIMKNADLPVLMAQ